MASQDKIRVDEESNSVEDGSKCQGVMVRMASQEEMIVEDEIKPVEDETQCEATLMNEPLMETHLAREIDKHEARNEGEQTGGVYKYRWLFIVLINVGLVAFLFGYAFVGGSIFIILEQGHEMNQYREFQKARDVLKQGIANLTGCDATKDMIDVEQLDIMLEKFEHKMMTIVCDANVDITGKSRWTFWSSVFFSATVISTIGYGNIAPVTAGGRAFCMVYAVFGIALLLLVLASLGTLLARGATLAYRAMHLSVMVAKGQEVKPKRSSKRRRSSSAMVLREDPESNHTPARQTSAEERREKVISDIWNSKPIQEEGGKDALPMHVVALKDEEKEAIRQKSIEEEEEEEEESEDDIQIPVLGVLLFAFGYICAVAAMLKQWEDEWSYYDAFYFSFITLTTIGFGDLVPQHQKNLLSMTFFILLGMAIMSMCIALAQDAIMKKVAWASTKIGVAIIKSKPTGK